MIDNDVVFDFITDKMLKIEERVVFAKRMIYNDSITGDYHINKVATADDKGTIRIYIKDLQKVNKYLLVGRL